MNTNLTEFFYSLTPDKILAAVEATGVRCTGRLLQLGSFENRVYEVEVDLAEAPQHRADAFRVVKFYRPGRWSQEQIAEEHAFLLELQGEDIPVVAPIPLLTGSTLGVIPHSEGSAMYFAVFPKVQGRRPEELKTDEIKILGRLLARMHLVGKRSPAKHRRTFTPDTFGLESIEALRQSGVIPPNLVDRYCAPATAICERARILFQDLPLHRIHGDCHLGNVLSGQAGFFFLDFDDMVIGPAVQDLWLLCGGRDEEGHKQRQIFLNAYEEFAEFPEASLKLIEPLRGIRYVHYSAWIAKRWDDPIFPRTFPHFKAHDYWINQLQDLEEVLELSSL